MSNHLKAIKVTDKVYWVGAIDWAIRDFHGYATNRGTTYNAYIILDEKVTLIDTVKKEFKEEFFTRISSIIDPEKIDYIISNHAELDHSGLLPDVIEHCKPEKVFASTMGVKALKAHFPKMTTEITALKDAEKLSIGKSELSFIEARMLHWPDSMITYMEDEGILFTNDIFGMHLATLERFDDEVNENIINFEAAKYYANIVLPYSPFVTKLINKVESLNLNIKYLATDHGPIWRKNIGTIISSYKEWAEQKPSNTAIIVYDTMWGSTHKMATAIAEGIRQEGVVARLTSLKASHRSDVMMKVFKAGALVVGSPVLNGTLFPTVVDVLTYIKGLRPTNLICSSFGSYGWNKGPLNELKDILTNEIKAEYVGDLVVSSYVPDDEVLNQCVEQGRLIAQKLKEKTNEQTVEMQRMWVHT